MIIKDVYVTEYGEDLAYQTYFVKFELVNDTLENILDWNKLFRKFFIDNQPIKLTIEVDD